MADPGERIARLSPERRRLLERLIEERDAAPRRAPEGIERRPAQAPPVLSSAQRRMWFLARSDPESIAYNVPFAVRLKGPLDTGALLASFEEIARRHEVLRTAFPEHAGQPAPRVAADPVVHLHEICLARLPGDAALATSVRLAAAESARPVDVSRLPLFRPRLLRLAVDDHILHVIFHHIVFDGWSVGVLLAELTALYPVLAAGGRPALPPLPVQYADYAYWQQRALAGAPLERLLGYWRRRLDGAPPEMLFAGRGAREGRPARHTGSLPLEITGETYSRLKAFCAQHGLTTFIALAAALKALLARYCGTEDVVVGTQSAGRNRREVAGLIGLFINPLALRTDLSGHPGLAELCRRVRETVSGAFAHQELPFDRLVAATQARTSGVRHPLFNVVLSLRTQSMESSRLGELSLEPLPGGGRKPFAPKFDLVLSAVDTGSLVGGAVEFDPDLFSEPEAADLVAAYRHLLAEALARPERPLAAIGLLSPERRRALVAAQGATAAPYPRGVGLHQLFERTADRLPDRVALSFAGGAWSYGELDRQANRLAHHLRELGLAAERTAALCFDRSPEVAIGVLATLKAGGAFVVLDPRAPRKRLARVLAEARPRALVTHSTQLAALPEIDCPVVCLDRDASAVAGCSAARPALPVAPEGLAYLIFTSGSTGVPKGVMGHHQGMANLSEAQLRAFEVTPESRVLQHASLTFDAFLWELIMVWRTGACLEIGRWEQLLPGPELAALVARRRVTHLTIPPSIMAALPAAEPGAGEPAKTPPGAELPSLTTLIVAGEACPAELATRWAPGRRMINAYGPTETTVWAAYDECVSGAAPPIGRAIANLQVYLVDRHLEPVPRGMLGEIAVGGAGLTRGYHRRPDLTAERFVPDPFSPRPGGRLYRTGDLGLYLPDGRVRFEGRADDQVKIRGFRVEPGEVEKVLAAHPGLSQVHVGAVERQAGEPRLVAWYVARPGGGQPPLSELQRWVERRLPSYLRPAAYSRLESMPLTPHGKIDRGRLPDPDWGAAARRRRGPGELRGPAEKTLAGIWSAVLGVAGVDRDDNFFELGGDSVLSIQIISRAAQAGLAIEVGQIFDQPTIAELAAAATPLEGAGGRPGATSPTPAAPAAAAGFAAGGTALPAYPLSPLQEGMLYHCLKAPGSSLYVQQFSLTLDGALDREALRDAWQGVLDRHGALRTELVWEGVSSPLQRVHPRMPVPFHYEDWSDLSADGQRVRWRRYQGTELQQGFRLDRPPLLRCALFRLAAERFHFSWLTHHLVVDGWSFSVIVRDLFELYRAATAGQAAELPEPPPFSDYIAWLATRDSGVAEAYWRRALAGFSEPVRLAAERPDGSAEPGEVGEEIVVLPPGAGTRLAAFARRRRLTLNTLVQASWALVVSRYTGRRDVAHGLTMAGRPGELPGVEHTVGLFINTLPLRLQLPRDAPLGAWLPQVQEALKELQRHSYSSLAEVQRLSAVAAGEPLFDSVVAFQNYPQVGGRSGGLADLRVEAVPTLERTDYPLTLLAEPGETFRLRFNYDRRWLRGSTVARLAGHLRNALATLPDLVERPLGEGSLLGPGERHQVLLEWNDTQRTISAGGLLHERIVAQAAVSPDATALVVGDQRLTYGELARRTARLAAWLSGRGVGPETLVGIFAERAVELVVALLAVLRAGGAFLPLAVEHPAARVGWVLAQARPVVVLTQARLAGRLPPGAAEVVVVEHVPAGAAAPPVPALDPGSLAYVLYTSGSTGEPHGVMVPHGAILNRILWGQQAYPLGAGGRVLQKTPYTFDVSLWELFWPLLAGACLVVARPGGHRDPAYLAALIARRAINVLHFVPSMLEVFLETPGAAAACGGVERVFTSGEALVPSLRDRFFAHLDAELFDLYGPTEAAIEVTHWRCRRADPQPAVPIGYPIANLRMHVLDAAGRPTPAGAPGELHIGGAGLARGYLENAGLTAARFVPDPFAHRPGGRLYRTGDLGRYRMDGAIDFLGRVDWQVKVRGQRVEPREIEEHLRRVPGVRGAVVVYRRDGVADGDLVAYLAGDAVDEALLRSALAERLPEYMVPARFVFLEALPLSLSGKVDRRALPAPEAGIADRPFLPGRDALEIELAGLWSEVLGVAGVGLRDGFFYDLGGHSLLALRLLGRVQERFSGACTLTEFLRQPTVEGMARALRHGRSADAGPLVPLRAGGSRPPLFLAHPGLGVVLCYVELARELGAEQPVFAFQAPGLDGRDPPLDEVPAFAHRYLAAMRRAQPAGPYHLGGFSFGGVVAFEMARQLAAAGEEVASLIILDTLAPAGDAPAEVVLDEAKLLAEIAGVLERYYGASPSIDPAELAPLAPAKRFREVQQRLEARGILSDGSDALRLERLFAVNRAAIEGLARYRPAPLPGRIHLVRCADPTADDVAGVDPARIADPAMGWSRWSAQPVAVRRVPGDHVSFIRMPSVGEVAREIAAVLGGT